MPLTQFLKFNVAQLVTQLAIQLVTPQIMVLEGCSELVNQQILTNNMVHSIAKETEEDCQVRLIATVHVIPPTAVTVQTMEAALSTQPVMALAHAKATVIAPTIQLSLSLKCATLLLQLTAGT